MTQIENKILEVIKLHKAGHAVGITSVCSANKFVIKSAILNAKKNNDLVLIEATSNQVDQYGGYTGLTPQNFKDIVFKLADEIELPQDNLILGGDHLGPNRWQNENSSIAMQKAKEQIAAYVKAGYAKIHLDASMKCADDGNPEIPLNPEIVAERTAELCKVSEEIVKNSTSEGRKPIYIIGSDVPPPGGSKDHHQELRITSQQEVKETIELTLNAFKKNNLMDAWERVVAVVVQPGVEFTDSYVFDYDRKKAEHLTKFIENNNKLVYEAHSTDYQKRTSLRKMVEDHFAILKVGPWLTFALREALFALSFIEREYLKTKKTVDLSNLIAVVENQMLNDDKYWKKYYSGSDDEKRFKIKYSFSDRIRYYWNYALIDEEVKKLLRNLNTYKIPSSLISQFLPNQYLLLVEGEITNNPEDLILSKISDVLEIYNYATKRGII